MRALPTADERRLAVRFDDHAEAWERVYGERRIQAHWWRARLRTAVRLLGPGPGSILDVGMGPGRLLAELDRLGWTVAGVDAAPRMVDLARRRLPEATERLVHGRAERLPFPDATFDAVVATGLLGYTAVDVAVAELARVLRPAGRAVLSFPNAWAPYRIGRDRLLFPPLRALRRVAPIADAPRRRASGRREFERRLEAAGLRVETVEYASCAVLPHPFDLLAPRAATWLAERAEARPCLRRVLAMQLVAAARKPERAAQAAPDSSR